MSALVQTRAINFLDAEFRAQAYTALTGTRKLKLLTSATVNETTAGTEISTGGGYSAGGAAIAFSAAASDGTAPQTYSAKIECTSFSITNMPVATSTNVEITDTAGTPVRAAWGALTTPRTTASGDTLSFAAASVVVKV